jgi:uncharacterized protein YicC (UPF0701 family)
MSEETKLATLRADIKETFTNRLNSHIGTVDSILTEICKEFGVSVSFAIAAALDAPFEKRKGDKK